jgi:hypothetical protein
LKAGVTLFFTTLTVTSFPDAYMPLHIHLTLMYIP